MLSHNVSPSLLDSLLAMLSSSSAAMPTTPTTPASTTSNPLSFSNMEDTMSNLLLLLSQTADSHSPPLYTHFSQTSSLFSSVALPTISSIPPINAGVTICGWIKLGVLGNTPTATLFHITVPSSSTSSSSSSSSSSASASTSPTSASFNTGNAYSLIAFFRIVNKLANAESDTASTVRYHVPSYI